MRNFKVCIFVSLVFVFSSLYFASVSYADEAGLVTYVSNNVYFSNDGNEKEKVVSFMKAKKGDTFFLEDGAKLHLVYFKNGRKEKWEGKVDISVSEDKSVVVSSVDKKPSVSTSDNSVEGLRAIPSVIENINTERTGSVTMRSLTSFKSYEELTDDEKKIVMNTNKIYETMLKTSDPDDITPELYSIGRLAELNLYEETLGVVLAALKKQPDNEGLKILKENLIAIIKRNKKDS